MFTSRQAKMLEPGRKGRHTKPSPLQGHAARLPSTCAIAVAAVVGMVLSVLLPSGSARASNACPPDYAYTQGGNIYLGTHCDTVHTPLTTHNSGVTDYMSALSPDGKHVAFVRASTTVNDSRAEVVPTTGGRPIQITGLTNVERVAWSPNGAQLVISAGSSIVIASATTGTVVRTLNPGLETTYYVAIWCGNKIVFHGHGDAGDVYLYTMNPNGSGITRLANIYGDGMPACSPDGKWVFFYEPHSGGGGGTHIGVMPLAGGPETQLTADEDPNSDDYYAPTVSSNWTLGYVNLGGSAVSIKFQWLGGTASVDSKVAPGNIGWPSFASGNGSATPPPGFPIAWNGSSPSPTPSTQPEAFGGGDSYASGEGAGDYTADTSTSDNHCHRSPHSYQQLVANRLGYHLNLHACSGAVVQDFYSAWNTNHTGLFDPPNPGEIAQLDWVNRSDKLVMVSIGGNNAHFPEVIKGCVTRDHLWYPTCEDEYGSRVRQWILQIQTSGELVKLYKDLKARAATGARVLINEYPRFFPISPKSSCDAGGITFGKSDEMWINQNILWLDEIITAAAKQAGVTPVNTYDAFDGHELCTSQPWMNGLILSLNGQVTQQSFHPNGLGYAAEAKLNLLKLGIR